ncbi:type II secretion system F family protein [Geodermatophilus sp. SYSU D00691]
MTGALLALSAAMLAWPDAGSVRRSRLSGGRRRGFRHPGPRSAPVLAAAVAAVVAALASTPLVAVLAGCCAALAARAAESRRRTVRRETELAAVTQALGALVAELRSGRPPDVAAAAAARSCGDGVLADAFVRAVRDPPARRAPPPGPAEAALDRLAAAVRLSRSTGAALSDVVVAVEDDLRARARRQLELRSAVAGPRASAALLAGLPLLGLAMGSGIGADPWGVLTTTGPGQVLLVAGVALEVAGVAWSRRLVARAAGRAAPGAR